MSDLESEIRIIDAGLERMAIDSGAEQLVADVTIPREVLARAGHFDAFPGMAVPASPDETSFFAPAACYHVYARLAGARLDAPRSFTLLTTCAREEVARPIGPGRLRHFRMREVVFVGRPAWVASARDDWMKRAEGLASSLGLSGTMEEATDMFFGPGDRGRRLIQQMKKSKYELRMNAGAAGELAVASFNLHETFFTERFDIRLEDGTRAASGCAAFGLERCALAHLTDPHAHLR